MFLWRSLKWPLNEQSSFSNNTRTDQFTRIVYYCAISNCSKKMDNLSTLKLLLNMWNEREELMRYQISSKKSEWWIFNLTCYLFVYFVVERLKIARDLLFLSLHIALINEINLNLWTFSILYSVVSFSLISQCII